MLAHHKKHIPIWVLHYAVSLCLVCSPGWLYLQNKSLFVFDRLQVFITITY